MDGHHSELGFLRSVQLIVSLILISLILTIGMCLSFLDPPQQTQATPALVLATMRSADQQVWRAPDSTLIPATAEGDLIRYGKDLISHTAKYLGPRGTVRAISNGMNCQNCHLKSGTKPFGNNYAAVVSTYPKFRARSGAIETIEKRINDCLERSLNGQKLEEDSREMKAIIAWFKWLGKDVAVNSSPKGTGLISLPFLSRPADPVNGEVVYKKHCQLCHGISGEGVRHPDSVEWTYPPLAGRESYNTGAGLYRLSRFAGYVKSNMPNGTTYENPVLTNEEAWDVAAYINSLSRPEKHFREDWPDVKAKPFDHPFGPYADSFSEQEHKYGPYEKIKD